MLCISAVIDADQMVSFQQQTHRGMGVGPPSARERTHAVRCAAQGNQEGVVVDGSRSRTGEPGGMRPRIHPLISSNISIFTLSAVAVVPRPSGGDMNSSTAIGGARDFVGSRSIAQQLGRLHTQRFRDSPITNKLGFRLLRSIPPMDYSLYRR
jgi:hypothetical protein